MPFIRSLLAALALCLTLAHSAWAQELDDAKRADIEQLLALTQTMSNARANMNTVLQQLVLQLRQKQPKLTEEHLRIVAEAHEAVFDENIGVFKALMVHLYHKHFSADDIRQLLVFYASDTGRKLTQVTPALNRESFEIGVQFGRLLGPKVEQRVKERLASKGVSL